MPNAGSEYGAQKQSRLPLGECFFSCQLKVLSPPSPTPRLWLVTSGGVVKAFRPDPVDAVAFCKISSIVEGNRFCFRGTVRNTSPHTTVQRNVPLRAGAGPVLRPHIKGGTVTICPVAQRCFIKRGRWEKDPKHSAGDTESQPLLYR